MMIKRIIEAAYGHPQRTEATKNKDDLYSRSAGGLLRPRVQREREQRNALGNPISYYYENGGINTPPQQYFNTPAMQGSFQQVLSENLGQYVVIEFLIGTQNVVRKFGVLNAVGSSFLTLYEEESQTSVVCDRFSAKFVAFYLPGRRPQRFAGPGGMGGMADPVSDYGPVSQGPGGGVTLSGFPDMNSNFR